ncbi:unnamed protein product [Rhodiola kirilowii]
MGSLEIEIVEESNERESEKVAPGVDVKDVFSAAAYGDIGSLRRFVEEEGCDVSVPDGNGYYPLQLAALNAYPNVVHYVIEGVMVEVADANGFRAVHIAAQYGQTAFLDHLIFKYNADINAPDNGGRTALHWAAHKQLTGCFCFEMRLQLSKIMMNLMTGCTPLHWAALTGNLEVCTILLHASNKEELTVKDKAGFTPAQLASDRGYQHIALSLSKAERALHQGGGGKTCVGKLRDIGYAPIKDPGFIPLPEETKNDTEDPLLKIDLKSSPIWKGNWSQLCPSCKALKISFHLFTTLLDGICNTKPILLPDETWIHNVATKHPGFVCFLVIDAMFLAAASTLFLIQAYQILCLHVDISQYTNEAANAARYGYLQGPDGKFHNPYNHGFQKNCTDFLIYGYTTDENSAQALLWSSRLQSMDVPPALNVFSDQVQLYGCWQSGMTGSVQNSNSSTGSNVSFAGLSFANQAGLQKPKDEVSSWEDGSMFASAESLSLSRTPLGNKNYTPKASLGVMKTLPAARNGDPRDHIMAERRRREKLSQRFIALSAIVPGLKKTDKASVLGDTIKYLKQMQERVKALEEEAKQKSTQSMVVVKKSHILLNDETQSFDDTNCFQKSFNDNSLPEIEARICDKHVLIRIHCEKKQGVVEQVLAEMEKLHLSVVNTSVLSFGTSSLNITIIALMDSQFHKSVKDIVMSMFSSVQHCT